MNTPDQEMIDFWVAQGRPVLLILDSGASWESVKVAEYYRQHASLAFISATNYEKRDAL